MQHLVKRCWGEFHYDQVVVDFDYAGVAEVFMKLGVSIVCCNKFAELSESISRKKTPLGNFFIPITFGGGSSCSGRAVFLIA